MSPKAMRAVLDHPRNGGTLIAEIAIGAGMREVFGFDESVPSRSRLTMSLEEQQPGGLILPDPLERSFRLGNPDNPEQVLGTYGYTNPRESPLAKFEDGTAAITRNSIGKGEAYAVGLDLGDFLQRGFNGRADWLTRTYVNEYEPASDVLMGWLRAVYRAAEPSAVTLGTVPEGRAFSLVMTHDIDAQNSLKNSITYAQYEKSRGVRATYFVQVKYIKDWNDIALIDRRTAGYLYELNSLGMEVASHSVCHSFVFETFPEGSGAERYPGYRPFVFNKMTTRGGPSWAN